MSAVLLPSGTSWKPPRGRFGKTGAETDKEKQAQRSSQQSPRGFTSPGGGRKQGSCAPCRPKGALQREQQVPAAQIIVVKQIFIIFIHFAERWV